MGFSSIHHTHFFRSFASRDELIITIKIHPKTVSNEIFSEQNFVQGVSVHMMFDFVLTFKFIYNELNLSYFKDLFRQSRCQIVRQ